MDRVWSQVSPRSGLPGANYRLQTGVVIEANPNPAGAHLGLPNRQASRFTAREAEIVRLIASDFSDKEVARTLGISGHTLRTHLSRLYRRNGVHSRAAAVALWILRAHSLLPGTVADFGDLSSNDDRPRVVARL